MATSSVAATATSAPAAQPAEEEIVALWREADLGESPEGRFVWACDKLDMALQAARYEQLHGLGVAEFVDSALAALDDPSLAELARR